MASNNRRPSRCRFISNRLYEIKYSNEVLNKGLSELEALSLRMQTGKVDDKNEAHQTATVLSGQNNYLAHAINSSLQEVESILRQHVEGGAALNKDTIHEFSEVLKDSIRILHDYQIIQESYSIQESKSNNAAASTTLFGGKSKRGHNRRRQRKPTILQRVIQSFRICGVGVNVYN